MSRLDIMTPSRSQTVIDGLYRDVERRIASSPPGLCPVDLALSFLRLCHAQTCGKCVPCRIGLGQLATLLEQVLNGEATMETLSIIERTARVIYNSADCAIGRDAARLVSDGLAGFRDDYEEHILHHRCLGGMQNPVPCVALCPAGVDIPGYVALVGENDENDIPSGFTREECFSLRPAWQRFLVIAAGPFANILLACGASPIMADDRNDVEDITTICGGLNINIGTLNQNTVPSMLLAGKKANELGHQVLLDPVGAGAGTFRTETALNLMREVRFDVIRGNISEIKTLARGFGRTKGVDADAADAVTEDNLSGAVTFVREMAAGLGCIIAVTGAIDLVSDGNSTYVIRNGRPEMGQITGTGCQLSGVMTAYITANLDNKLEAAAAAVCVMGLAGEIGWRNMQEGDGNSTYRNRIIDAIYNMNAETLAQGAKYEIQ